jgi:hypothetical protein
MNNSMPGKVISTLAVIFALSACTTRVEISHSRTLRADELGSNFRLVKTQDVSNRLQQDGADARGGFFLVELKSKTDLETIVRRKEMAFLYYELHSCGSDKEQRQLYSAPAYVDAQSASSSTNDFYYYAPVPRNYTDEVNRYLSMLGKEDGNELEEICIGLGAGNMAGQRLTTNVVRIDLPLQW